MRPGSLSACGNSSRASGLPGAVHSTRAFTCETYAAVRNPSARADFALCLTATSVSLSRLDLLDRAFGIRRVLLRRTVARFSSRVRGLASDHSHPRTERGIHWLRRRERRPSRPTTFKLAGCGERWPGQHPDTHRHSHSLQSCFRQCDAPRPSARRVQLVLVAVTKRTDLHSGRRTNPCG